jgi:hypothetical protein
MPERFLDNPIFTIVFKRGKADKHRLPLAHVIATLNEIEKMIREVGIQVQRSNGVENANGDFGVDLVAGESGIAFNGGSITAEAAMTVDIRNGVETLGRIIDVTDSIEKKRVYSVDQYGEPVFRRLAKVSGIQEQDKTELQLRLVTKKKQKPKLASFSERGMQTLRELSAAELAVESVALYGKLRRLTDFSKEDEGDHFWGELREDSGREWRIKFKLSDLARAQKLFTKQVEILGDATYFKTKNPRIDVRAFSEEKPRDYVAAFNRFRRSYSDVFGNSDPGELLDDIRG